MPKPRVKGGRYSTTTKYSTNRWKEVRPNEKIINCPTDDPLYKLVGAIIRIGFQSEGASYFTEECERHPQYSCASFWSGISNMDIDYLKRKTEELYYTNGDKKIRRRR